MYCLIHNQVAQPGLAAEVVQPLGLRALTCPPKTRRKARTQSCHAISLTFKASIVKHCLCSLLTSFWLWCCTSAHEAAAKRTHRCYQDVFLKL